MKNMLIPALACLGLLLPATPVRAAGPNIVLIVADDLGYGDTSALWPESDISTPGMERLAREGITFTNYRTQPLCTPSRAALLTGLFNAGFNQEGSAHLHGMDSRLTVLPEYLRRMGYRTAGFGKWHLGSDDGDHPLDRGFERWVGFYGGSMPYHYTQGHDHVFDGKRPLRRFWRHSTDLFADLATRFIQQHRDQPFFLYLAFNAVHTPIWSKERPIYSSRQDWRQTIRKRGVSEPMAVDYYALVEHMDERIGQIIDTLQELGIADDTLVIFVSDNGAITPEHFAHHPQMGSNGIFRGGKASFYEGGIRVPLIASWPGTLAEGARSDQPVLDADLLPTVLEAAGIIRQPGHNGPREMNGFSLLPLMKAPEEVRLPQRGTPSWLGSGFAYVKYPWKLMEIRYPVGGPQAQGLEVTDGRLLFNLAEDPSETTDRAPSEEALARQLWEEYQDLYYATRKPLHPDHDVPRRIP